MVLRGQFTKEQRMELPNFRKLRVTLVPVLLCLVLPFFIFTPIIQQRILLNALNDTVASVRSVVAVASQANISQDGV